MQLHITEILNQLTVIKNLYEHNANLPAQEITTPNDNGDVIVDYNNTLLARNNAAMDMIDLIIKINKKPPDLPKEKIELIMQGLLKELTDDDLSKELFSGGIERAIEVTTLILLNELTTAFNEAPFYGQEITLANYLQDTVLNNNEEPILQKIRQQTAQENKYNSFIKKNYRSFIKEGDQLLESLYTSADKLQNSKYKGLYQKFNLEPFRAQCQNGIVKKVIKLFSKLNLFKTIKQIFKPESVDTIQQRQDHLAAINSLLWSIHNKAIKEQGKDVERGSFTLKDPNNKLFAFLLDYVKLANNGNTEGFLTGSDLAYSRNPANRLSSHHKTDQKQYGIDMRFNRGDYTIPILPGNMPHLLFGQIDINGEKHTFIKFERVGLGNAFEAMLHGKHYLETRNHISKPENTKEFREKAKDIPPDLTKIYTDFCTKHNITPKKKALIYEMVEVIDQYEAKDPDAKKAFVNCAAKHNLNNLEIRKAKEVIIDLAKLFISKKLNKDPLKKFAKPVTTSTKTQSINDWLNNTIPPTIKNDTPKKPPNNSNSSK